MVHDIGSYTASAVAHISVWRILSLATIPGWQISAIVEIVWSFGTIWKLAQNLTTWKFWFFLSTKPDLENALQFLYARGKSPQKSSALDMPKNLRSKADLLIAGTLISCAKLTSDRDPVGGHRIGVTKKQSAIMAACNFCWLSHTGSDSTDLIIVVVHLIGLTASVRRLHTGMGELRKKRHASALVLRCHRSSASADSDLVICDWKNVTFEEKMPNLTF